MRTIALLAMVRGLAVLPSGADGQSGNFVARVDVSRDGEKVNMRIIDIGCKVGVFASNCAGAARERSWN